MTRRDLDIGDLQYFLALVRSNRLAAAGERLGADHTTVRRRIRALEAVFGQRLFDKTATGWQLTAAGERLLPHARAIERETAAALADVAGAEPEVAGTVRLLTTDGFGVNVVAPAMAKFRAAHPEIKVELVTASRIIHHGVGDFDAAVTVNRPSMSGIETHRLCDYALRLYASPAYLERSAPISSTADLSRHDFVWFVQSLLDLPELRTAEAVLPGANVVFRTSNISAQLEAVAAGVGIGLLPCFMAEDDPRLRPVLPAEVEVRRTYWLILPPTLLQADTVRVVCGFLARLVLRERLRLSPPAPAETRRQA
jgi:DNA-binding transcriptional LysR family regulator